MDFMHPRHPYSDLLYAQSFCLQLTLLFYFIPTFIADQSKGHFDALAALFLKLDHAACRNCAKTWETFADTLKLYFTTRKEDSLGELWDERADWWPGFHFRQDQVPDKGHVSVLEWQLTRHKAEAARRLLGKGTVSASFLLSLSVLFNKIFVSQFRRNV